MKYERNPISCKNENCKRFSKDADGYCCASCFIEDNSEQYNKDIQEMASVVTQ